jgi:NAD(P)-dependent dehydrogenase (short-subunit alcohol dehydrogenase family)
MTTAEAQRPLADQTILVTGATSGIGYQTAQALAGRGAQVIITGRRADIGEQAAAAMRQESGAGSITFMRADHATVGGNQELAERVRATVPRLDVLVNNVGGLYPTRWETADGYEATLAMNFVGPYALIAELLPLLHVAAPSRCVNVVSAGFKLWKTDPFTDVQSTEQFVSGDVYAHTKLLNVLSSLAWARRLTADRITVNVIHPGMSWTTMTQSMTVQTMPSWRLIWPVIRLVQRRGSPVKAGSRVALVASSPRTARYTGRYFEGKPRPAKLPARALNTESQDQAWRLGAELVAAAPTHRQRRDNPDDQPDDLAL